MTANGESWVRVGEVGIDGGVIRLADNNYASNMVAADPNASWNNVAFKETWFGMCPGVDIATGHGDGTYPVYAQMFETDPIQFPGHKTVRRVMIDFLTDEATQSESAGSTKPEENEAAGGSPETP